MTEFKIIDEKPVWILFKKYSGGLTEIIGVYWKKEMAERVAVSNLPKSTDCYALALDEIKLFGSMVDIV
jgi:hypothetical protein